MAEVVIYTTPWCPYCNAAKALLDRKGVAYTNIDVAENATLRAEVIERSGRRTVPQIFIDGIPVGGFDDISALDAAGELDPLLDLA